MNAPPAINPFASPAVRVDRVAAAPTSAPVRMDVAAFVGRVQSGTLAAVEGPAEFSAAFQESPDSRLGPAVRAFFRNGGQRCWIVPADPPFFDPRLVTTGIATLASEAALLDDPLARPKPGETLTPPTGIHTVLVLDEVTLLAVPDAFPPRQAPKQSSVNPAAGGGSNPSPLTAPGFKTCVVPDPAVLALVVKSAINSDAGRVWREFSWDWQQKSSDLRQKAAALAAGPTVTDQQRQEIADLKKTADDWDATRAGATFVLERATTNAFFPSQTETIYRGLGFAVMASADADFYRVRAETSALVGGWATPPAPAPPPTSSVLGKEDPVATQVAAVKVCAARGDVLAVLTPPEDWPDIPLSEWVQQWAKNDAENNAKGVPTNDWVGIVQKSKRWLGPEETGALRTHAAFWGPWVLMRDGEHPILFTPNDKSTAAQRLLVQQAAEEPDGFPADGSICGLLAQQSLVQGAWASILNLPIIGALGTGPPLSSLPLAKTDSPPYGPGTFVHLFASEPPATIRDTITNQQAAGINVLARTSRGIVPVGEYTASSVQPPEFVSVRRCLAQLRQELLRAGAELAFAPNGPALERRATRVVEGILERMLQGGAFIGADASSAFRVTARAGDPGTSTGSQLVVEVRVRVARPLRILTLRFIRSDDGSFTIAEGQS